MSNLTCKGCKERVTAIGSAIEESEGVTVVFCNKCSMGSEASGNELMMELPSPNAHLGVQMAILKKLTQKHYE